MEDKIRTILKYWLQTKDEIIFTDDIAIEEITSEISLFARRDYYEKEFVKWLLAKNSKYAICYGSDKPLCTTRKDFSIEEVYQYWLKEVKGE
jgi:hypothetical protein